MNLSKKQITDIITEQINSNEDGLQQMLEITLNALMKSERSNFLQDPTYQSECNKANGYRQAFVMGHGRSLQLSVPRDRLGVFKPLILALYRDEEERVRQYCFDLYGMGLTTSQIGKTLERLYGKYYSSAAISQITASFRETMEEWRNRPIAQNYPVICIDAIHVKVRREFVSSEAFYVILGLGRDKRREVLGIVNFPRESAIGWQDTLERLQQRGLEDVNLVISDNLVGLDAAIHRVLPNAKLQKCVVHLKRNIQYKVKPGHKKEIAGQLKAIFNTTRADFTLPEAESHISTFVARWQRYYPAICKQLNNKEEMAYYFTYLSFHHLVRGMLYTTNWIERLNKSLRRTLKIRGAMPSVISVLTLLSKVAIDMNEGCYHYPIYAFKWEENLFDTTKET